MTGTSRVADATPPPAETLAVEWLGAEPVPDEERYGKPSRVGLLWFAAQLVPTSFFLGVLATSSFIGLGFWSALAAIVLGNALGALPVAWLSLMGPATGLPQLPLAKTAFGRGVMLVGPLAFCTSVSFIALGAIFGAEALQVVFGLPFVPGVALVFALEGFVSTIGYRFMHQFERAMVIVVGVGFLLLSIVVLTKTGQISVKHSAHGAGAVGAFVLLTTIVFSFAFGWAPNSADYCRYLPASTSPKRLLGAVFGSLFAACVWMETLGLAAGTLLPNAKPMHAVDRLVGGGALGAAVCIAIYLGVAANATVANYSAGLQLLSAGIRLPRPLITVVSTAVAFALTLYLHTGDLAEKATNVVLLATYWIGPFVAIVAVRWWRETPHHHRAAATTPIRALPHGGAAIAALVVGFLASLPFSNTTLGYQLSQHGGLLHALFGSVSSGPLHGADVAYYVGIVVGGAVYVVLSRSPNLRKEPTRDEQR